jgi:hypothetical protein
MSQLSRENQESLSAVRSLRQKNGFILLEVLVALSLVVSSWVALGSVYQGIILRLGQLQEKRDAITKELDRHEMDLLNTVQFSSSTSTLRKLPYEFVGMSRRPHPFPDPRRASDKK